MSLGLAADATVGLLLLIALASTGTYIHHRGYVSGQNERTAYYAPLFQAANDAQARANQRADKLDELARSISDKSERDHALYAQTLYDRTSAADARIADLLRQRAAARVAACREQVPPLAGTAVVTAGAPSSDPRDQRLADSVSRVGGQCEHDADELAEFQRWYARQKDAIESMSTEKNQFH